MTDWNVPTNVTPTGPGNRTGLLIEQQITMITNKFRVRELGPNGEGGALIAFAEQKKMKLREEIEFFTDESKRELVFSLKSRNVIDMAATTDVFDARRQPIASFRKDAMASMLNSTWHVETPAFVATGKERSQGVALARRFGGMLPVVGDLMEMIPWQFHFDFVDQGGQTVLSVERQRRIRDAYVVTIPDGRMDWRLAAALGVAMDVFQGR